MKILRSFENRAPGR